MKIGLCGTMSVGKTTLVNELSKLPKFEGYKFSTERSKYLKDLGIPLNTDSTLIGQQIFNAERYSELMNENIITDRTLWDISAFTLNSKTLSEKEKSVLLKSHMLGKKMYDLVIYISPEGTKIEDNGVRETDVEYRELIDLTIQSLLSEYKPEFLIEVKGNNDKRIKDILRAVELIKKK